MKQEQPNREETQRKELKPNTEGWNKTLAWLVANPSKAHTIKINYIITDADFDALIAEAKDQPDTSTTQVEVPVETLDAIKSANSSEELTRLWNELTDLHSSKAFVAAWDKRRKEILLPSKDKKAA